MDGFVANRVHEFIEHCQAIERRKQAAVIRLFGMLTCLAKIVGTEVASGFAQGLTGVVDGGVDLRDDAELGAGFHGVPLGQTSERRQGILIELQRDSTRYCIPFQ